MTNSSMMQLMAGLENKVVKMPQYYYTTNPALATSGGTARGVNYNRQYVPVDRALA